MNSARHYRMLAASSAHMDWRLGTVLAGYVYAIECTILSGKHCAMQLDLRLSRDGSNLQPAILYL